MHKHTDKTWPIGACESQWNCSSVDEPIEAGPTTFNLKGPNYKEAFVTSFDGPSRFVLRYQVLNPGPWLFHYHIETQLASGEAAAILDSVNTWAEIPSDHAPSQRGFYPAADPRLEESNRSQKNAELADHVGHVPLLAGGRQKKYQ